MDKQYLVRLAVADGVEHGAARPQVKGHVVVEHPAGRERHGNAVAPVGEARVADVLVGSSGRGGVVAAEDAMPQRIGQVGEVRDAVDARGNRLEHG